MPLPTSQEYSSIKVQFLLPNKTSKVQPFDQGVIRVEELPYCTLIIQKFLRAVDTEDDVKEIMAGLDFIVTCKNIVATWNYVSDRLIEKCFHKADFLISIPAAAAEPEWKTWDNLQRVLNIQQLMGTLKLETDSLRLKLLMW